jgi:hypothetical protein
MLNANKFAVAIWIAAAVLVVANLFSGVYPFNYTSMMYQGDIRTFLLYLGNTLVFAGGLAALGAVVHLLGEIRDRLPERSN